MTRQLSIVALIALTSLSTRDSAAHAAEVLRDPWGVPHIFAETTEAGFFALGYACAEDRRVQMELARRKGAGRLAEAFGAEWVQADRESRIAGYTVWSQEALTKLPAEMQSWLASYAAGVNAWTSAPHSRATDSRVFAATFCSIVLGSASMASRLLESQTARSPIGSKGTPK